MRDGLEKDIPVDFDFSSPPALAHLASLQQPPGLQTARGMLAEPGGLFRWELAGDAFEGFAGLFAGFLPDFDAQAFEVLHGDLEALVKLMPLRVIEVEFGGNVAFEGRDDEIDWCAVALWIGDGAMHHAAQHEQAAADAAGGSEHEDEPEQQHGLPA